MTDPKEPSVLDGILRQFIAEYHQGLNELAGHGTAIEQCKSEILKHYIPRQEVEEAIELIKRALPFVTACTMLAENKTNSLAWIADAKIYLDEIRSRLGIG